LFEKETGVRTGVPAKARDRFARRHEVLTQTCRPAWVAWRCAKVHALVRRLRDTLAAARPDLRLTLTLWDETTVPQLLGWGSAATQLYARPSTAQLYREGGLDLALYEGEPGVEVDLGLGNSRDRGGHPHHSTDGLNAPVEAQCMYRDHDFLDAETLGAMAVQRRPGAFIFNCWVESWGEHTWFPCAPDDPQAKDLAVMDGQPAEGIFRLNSIYPSDGFWWDSQLRITPAFQGGVHFLEPYAHALAEFDALRITRGGLFLDKAHTGEIRRFAAAFRALPREKFEPVGASTDPVVVRARVSRGRRCFYLINRDDYTVRVELAFDRPPGRVTDLATGLPVRAARRWTCELGPYELRVFAMDAGVRIHGFEAHPPAEIQEAVLAAARRAVGHLEAARAAGAVIPGLDEFERRIETAMVSRRFAWLRRALTGYIVRKARESVGRAKEGLP
jgi:hypothetical protein